MSGSDISINTGDGVFGGYLAIPGTANGEGIVIIQEIRHQRIYARRSRLYAARGYYALAPDLFWRIEPGLQLTDKTKEEWNRAFALMNKFNTDLGIKDIQADRPSSRRGNCAKVGAVGYCLVASWLISQPRAPTRMPASVTTA